VYALITSQNDTTSRLPVLETFPVDGSSVVKPDTQITISIDTSSKNYNAFKQQFNKGSFTVKLNGHLVDASYDSTSNIVKVNNNILDRYTEYTVSLLLKAESKNSNTNSGNASFSFSFTTGSALNEATHMEAKVLNSPVRVTDKGLIDISVTDDYGLPANNATIGVILNSQNASANNIEITQSSNGKGLVEITDHVKEVVDLRIIAKDNIYENTSDNRSADCSIQFIAGFPHNIALTVDTPIKLNQTSAISAIITDCFGNLVEDDTTVDTACSSGTISGSQQALNGKAEFTFTPASTGFADVTISSADASATTTINTLSDGPIITVSSPVEEEMTVNDFTINIAGSVFADSGVRSLSYILNNEDKFEIEGADENWQIDNLNLHAGYNEIRLEAEDNDGNITVKLLKITFNLGVVAPLRPEDIVQNGAMSYVKNQVLITFNETSTMDDINQVISSINGTIVGYINGTNDYQVNIENELSEDELLVLVDTLNQNPLIDAASINMIMHISKRTNDYGSSEDWSEGYPYGSNWNLEAAKVPSAWDKLLAKGDLTDNVKIGVLDQDIVTHSDITYSYIKSPPSIIGPVIPPDIYHGTFVSGIIGAYADNGLGIAGVAWNPQVYAYNISLSDSFDIKFGLADLVTRGVRIINCSFGSGMKEEIQKYIFKSCEDTINSNINSNVSRLGRALTLDEYNQIFNSAARSFSEAASASLPGQTFTSPVLNLGSSDTQDTAGAKINSFFNSVSNMSSLISQSLITRVLDGNSITGPFSAFDKLIKDSNVQIKALQKGTSTFIQKLYSKKFDFLIVQAAGNNGMDLKGYGNFFYNPPGTPDNKKIALLTVGSLDKPVYIPAAPYMIYQKSNFSTYGSCVDIYAPGSDIYSINRNMSGNASYKTDSGTSFASPLVAGVAGLVLKANPKLKASQVVSIILDTANNTGTTKIIDANEAVKKAYLTKASGSEVIPDCGVIMGIVTKDKTQTPIKDATITVYKLKTGTTNTYEATGISTKTDDTGYYDFVLNDGKYKFIISASGYVSTTLYATVNNSVTKQNPQLKLQSKPVSSDKGTAKGQIVSALTGLPVSGATIQIYPGINTIGDSSIMTDPMYTELQTADDGKYTMELPVGNYTGFVSVNGYTSGFFYLISSENDITSEQDCVISPIIPDGQTRIVLTWGESPRDLDSHLTGPTSSGGRFHIYYSNKTYVENGVEMANLDYDYTSSYGPETVTVINQQQEGVYRYSVHDYTNRGSTSSMALSNSGAQVKVYRGDILLALFYIPPEKVGTLWTVFEMDGNNITPINTISLQSSPGDVQ